VTGSAAIGTSGGAVNAMLPGGGTLQLTVPPGALSTTTTITLEPVIPPPGSLASFRITPINVALDKPATLVVKVSSGAKLRPSSMLVLEQDGIQVPLGGTLELNEGTVTVTLSSLGLRASGTSIVSSVSARTTLNAYQGPATLNLNNYRVEQLERFADDAYDRLVTDGTPDAAQNMQWAMETLARTPQVTGNGQWWRLQMDRWLIKVCQFADFAINDLRSFGYVSDFSGLERVFSLTILWEMARKDMNVLLQSFGYLHCTTAVSAQAAILNKLVDIRPSMVRDLNAFAVEPSPRDSNFVVDRMRPLLRVATLLLRVGFEPEYQILLDIIRDQFIRLRHVGFDRCHSNPADQEIQGRLVKLLVVGPVPGLSLQDLREDIERCGVAIVWDVLDANGSPVRTGTLGIGTSSPPGQYTLNGSASLVGTGQLKLRSGYIQALLCPRPASDNNEQLEIAAGPHVGSLTRVAVLSPSGANRYLPVSDLHIGTDTLRQVAGIAPNDSGTVTVVMRRIGGDCSGLFFLNSHRTLATLTISFLTEIRFTFDRDLEGWTTTNYGVPDGTPPWSYTHWDSQNGKGVVNMDGRDTTSNNVPDAKLSKSIDLPAGITTMSFDVSAHNRPDSHVRCRLLINGQVKFDEVIVGPQPPAFRYVTKTVDVSAFAGQTVTIQFEQHDNGSNGQFPGSAKHMYIDNIRIR
jgi:hypothetical protein